MTEGKNTIFDYLGQILIIFGGTVLIFIVFGKLVGAEAAAVSSLFALGAEGLSFSTLLQLFALSVVLTLCRYLCFSDRFIREWSIVGRTVTMLLCAIFAIVLFILLFHWFPADNVPAWICFTVSFAVCFTVSTGITFVKEKMENQKMEQALQRINQQAEKGKDE